MEIPHGVLVAKAVELGSMTVAAAVVSTIVVVVTAVAAVAGVGLVIAVAAAVEAVAAEEPARIVVDSVTFEARRRLLTNEELQSSTTGGTMN